MKCGDANIGGNVELTYKGGCRKELDIKDAYRCGGCDGWFCKECLYKHFELEKEHDYGRIKGFKEGYKEGYSEGLRENNTVSSLSLGAFFKSLK